ncbi:MAG TPA: LAGLIDADG family homing endonuclease, partial [Terriglobales bacterium]|nr:LAGLIDADG family homing endonuclease [Terriglobales bacterium]
RELAKDPFIHRKLIASLAPSIYGYGDIKEAVLYLLFGGVPKKLPDGVNIRSEVNVLLVGDPGVAKSQLLQYVSRIAPRGLYTSGRGTTAAGLTAAVVREKNGGMVLEAGALVLADKGIACLTPDDEVYTGDRIATVSELWELGTHHKELLNGQEVRSLFCSAASYYGEQHADVKSYTNKIVRRKHDGPVLKIEFKSGLTIRLTPEHLIRSSRSSKRIWVPANTLQTGDIVKAPRSLFKPLILVPVEEQTAYTLGCIYGDGYVTPDGITISQSRNNEHIITNMQVLSPFKFARYDTDDKIKQFGKYVVVEKAARLWTSNKELLEVYNSTIGSSLDTILRFDDPEIAAFLAGVFDSDGNMNSSQGKLTGLKLAPTANEHHLSVLLHALRRLGIRGSIRRSRRNPNVHVIQITGPSMIRFIDQIIPWSVKAKIAKNCQTKNKSPHLEMDEEQVKQVNVEHYVGYVYDLCVREHHNFAAAGVYVHNCIDEMDKMRPEDRVAIHEALEQHTVSVAKGGIVATLNARAAVLAAANPSLGRYDPYRNITDNINLPVTLLSRFDLLFIMKDVPEVDADSRMSEHILSLHRLKTTPEEPPLSPELLRKYIAYAKRIEPVLTEESVNAIRQYYLKMRSLSGSTESPIVITPRQLEGLVRLAESRARSFLRDHVEAEDAQAIIRLMTLSLQDVGIDTTTGKIDIDVIMTGKPKSLRDKMQEVLSTFAELEKQLGVVDDSTLYQALARKPDITDDDARRLVDQLVKEGILYSPKPGHLKRTAA